MNDTMRNRTVKLKTVKEAVARIPAGASLALGGSYNRRHPMAFVHELIRQDKGGLTLYGWNNGIDYDLLIAAGLVKEAHSSYVGMANLGLAKNFRRAYEQKLFHYVDHTETTAQDRFIAASKGLTFAISKVAMHTDLPRQPEFQNEIVCPFTGERYHALEAWRADYALIHASKADKYGNIQFDALRMLENEPDLFIGKSAKKLIVSVEEIVDTEAIMQDKLQTLLPAFLVDCVCHVPHGAHPNSCDTRYDFDLRHGAFYQQCSATPEGIRRYIDEYIRGSEDFAEYLLRVENRNGSYSHGN